MFIRKGDRRINLEFIKEYKPIEKAGNFYVDITFIDGTKDSYSFFNKEDEQSKFLKMLDDHFLLTKS